ARALRRRTIGARAAARGRARLQTDAPSSCRPHRRPAPRQIAGRPHDHGPRAVRRFALGHALAHAAGADLRDEGARGDCRGPVRGALADHPDERTLSLLAIAVSNFDAHAIVQLELPLGLADEGRRPGTKKGIARSRADRAIDAIRKRFGAAAVDYGSAVRVVRSVPDEFRRLAEREL